MQIADRLKTTPKKCKQDLTSSEFLDWKVYIEQDATTTKAEHWYLAQIALEVRRVLHDKPNKVQLDDFMLDFEGGGKAKAKPAPMTQAEKEAHAARSRAAWFAITGYKKGA